MTSQVIAKPPNKRRNWSIAAGVLAVCAVGALVGTKAGNLAHRAPRGDGTRIAVLADPSLALARDAVVRDLTGTQGVTVIPPLVITSKQRAMVRGGIDDATDAGAADVLDADVVVQVTDADPARAIAAARTAASIKVGGRAPITGDLEAYAHFLEGERVAQGQGDLDGSIAHYSAAVARDPAFAEAWAGLAFASFFVVERTPAHVARAKDAVTSARAHAANLRAVNALVVDALHAWIAHDEAAPELRDALREPAIAACRTMTVQFPEERMGHWMLGRAYRELFNGPTEGLRHLESARRLTPEHFPITEQLVVGWLQLGDRKHAAQALRGYLATVKEHPEALQMARTLEIPNAQLRAGAHSR
jgi:tetratricopeptide (TPR) repeat protein